MPFVSAQWRACGPLLSSAARLSRHVLHPAVIRAAKLRRKLGAAPGLLGKVPRKPRHWRPDYWARMVAELFEAERVLAARLHDTLKQVQRRSEHDRHSVARS